MKLGGVDCCVKCVVGRACGVGNVERASLDGMSLKDIVWVRRDRLR